MRKNHANYEATFSLVLRQSDPIIRLNKKILEIVGSLYEKQGMEFRKTRKTAFSVKTTCCILVESENASYESFAKCHGLSFKVTLNSFRF